MEETKEAITALIERRFAGLTPQLRKAARYVIDNPDEIALHSMRTIAKRAEVQHNVMLRLARVLGFDSYDTFRDRFRNLMVNGPHPTWLDRAKSLRQTFPSGPNARLVAEYLGQEMANLQDSFGADVVDKLDRAVVVLNEARNIYVVGLRSLFSVAFYFHYVCRLFMNKTVLLTGTGGTFADDLRRVGKEDALVVFSCQPYAKDAVMAVDFARNRGTRILAVTDSKVSPVVSAPGIGFVIANSSTSLFPTVLPALAIAQVLATLLVSTGDEELLANVERSQKQLNSFGVYAE
jgi:DNA-binding MurR/RpiR family transcriptional regulator